MRAELIWGLLQVSLTTSAVMGLLLALVPLLRRRYAARWRYFAWLLVAVRLLLPFTLSLPQAPVQLAVPETFVAQPAPTGGQSHTPAQPQPADGATTGTGPAGTGAPAPAPQQAPAARTLTPAGLAAGIWLLGAAAYGLAQAAVYLRFRRRVRYCPRQAVPRWMDELWRETGAAMRVTRLPRLQISAAAPAPVLTGLFRPVLLLPHGGYTRRELGFILRHELVHHRRGDLWYRLLLTAAGCLHWFNPLVHLMAAQAGRDIELSCDDRVLAGLDAGERAAYGETILRALPVRPKWRPAPVLTTSFGGTKAGMRQRLKNLFDRSAKKRGAAALCALLVLVGLAGGLVACTTAPASGGPPDGPSSGAPANDADSPFAPYADYNLLYDAETDRLTYNGRLVRYFEDDGLFYNGDGTVSGSFVAHYPGEEAGEIDVYAVRSETKEFHGLKVADEDQFNDLTRRGTLMQETIAPYAALGLSADVIGTLYYDGRPVRELVDDTAGLIITHSMGAGYPENAVDLEAVYEDGSLTALRARTQAEFDARTAERILEVQAYWGIIQGGGEPEEDLVQYVSFHEVEPRTYSGGGVYIHDIFLNFTGKTITGYQRGMLAFDEDGQPLELAWNPFSDAAPGYYYLYDWADDLGIPPGTMRDGDGGWSLSGSTSLQDITTPSETVLSVKYVLYNLKQITFEDGTVWENPDYAHWLQTYEGKEMYPSTLKSYYPFVLAVE